MLMSLGVVLHILFDFETVLRVGAFPPYEDSGIVLHSSTR